MSRSAEPEPCAIQTPPQARITGSSAETRPLAGDLQRGRFAVDAIVDVGLAVGDDHHLRARQFLDQQLMQRLRRPFDMDAARVFALNA